MKMNKKRLLILIGIISIIFLIILIILGNKEKYNKEKLNNNGVSNNLVNKDENINFLYQRYHVEDNLKFMIAGSNTYSEDYAFYYKNNKITFKDFSNIYKSYILLDLFNHKDNYDEERKCFHYSLEEFKNGYLKYYGSIDDFEVDTNEDYNPHFSINENEDDICIYYDENKNHDYKKIVDTYMVNGTYLDDKIIIYECVAFIELTDKKIVFYNDYKMKNEVISLDKEKVDTSFINNSKIVSNVLLNYQDEFPIYKYTYKEESGYYYLESIEK